MGSGQTIRLGRQARQVERQDPEETGRQDVQTRREGNVRLLHAYGTFQRRLSEGEEDQEPLIPLSFKKNKLSNEQT